MNPVDTKEALFLALSQHVRPYPASIKDIAGPTTSLQESGRGFFSFDTDGSPFATYNCFACTDMFTAFSGTGSLCTVGGGFKGWYALCNKCLGRTDGQL
jgi:hypothetical protein